jgi:Phosphopantetheine attachment site
LILDSDNDQSFEQLLKHVKHELVGAFAAPDVPIEHLLSSLTGQGAASPLYLALFSYQDARSRPVNWGNLRHERLEVAKNGATEDFGLWFIESDVGLVGGLTFNTDLYRPDTAVILHNRLLMLLGKVAEQPTQPVRLLLAEFVTVKEPGAQVFPNTNGVPLTANTTNAGANTAAPVFETQAEEFMASVWANVLKVSTVERGDNFFDLGGNSLLAMQAVAKAEQHFKTKVHEQRYVFETLAQLAQAYQQAAPQVEPEKKSLMGRLFGRSRAGS